VSGYEIIEHTADVGLRARGRTLEECFEQATRALAAIMGVDRPGAGEELALDVRAGDLGAVLVEWLDEVLYVLEVRDALLAGVGLDEVDDERARGTLSLTERGDHPAEGVQVKAITLHRLSVRRAETGFVAEVYVDV
jgi:SHS2 domain-containing protein